MRAIIAAAAVLWVSAVHAQQVMDGSEKNLQSGEIELLFKAIRRFALDPYSAQLVELRATPGGWVCGGINAKNTSGGYVGFTRFAFGVKAGRIQYAQPSSPHFWITRDGLPAPEIDQACGSRALFAQ
jgi:hypothetical protein